MSRLTPLVRRRVGPRASFPSAAAPAAAIELGQAQGWLDDARLFATGWVGGLIVFGTLFA